MTTRRLLAVIGCLALGAALPLSVHAQPGGKVADPKAEPSPVLTPEMKTLRDLDMAYKLARYGEESKSAESLLVAARIIGTTPLEKKQLKGDVAPLPAGVKPYDPKDEAEELIQKALKLAGDKPGVAALAKETKAALEEKPRGAAFRPLYVEGFIGAGDTRTFQQTFKDLEHCEVRVRNLDRGTDLDLYVLHPPSGWSIRDRRSDSDCFLSWRGGGRPGGTGTVEIRIHNYTVQRGARFILITN